MPPEIPPALRVARSKLVKEEEIRRSVELMARKVGERQPILVVLDADDDCPAELGPRILRWAVATRGDRAIAVVVAKREFESWFVQAARSLRGMRGMPAELTPPADPEAVRDAKGWLRKSMGTYSPTTDQPALAALFDLEEARASSSFDKLVRDLARLLGRPCPPTA